MVDRLLQENGTDRYLLEDGSGVLLLEPPLLTATIVETANWTATTTPQSIVIPGALAGDLIVVMYGGDRFGTAVSAASVSTTAGSTSAWTEPEENLGTTNTSWGSVAYADVTTDGSVTISLARTQSTGRMWGGYAALIRNHGGAGVHGHTGQGATETHSLTVAEGSAVFLFAIDWDALSTVAFSPAGAIDVERAQGAGSPDLTWYAGYWLNQAAGTRGYGIATSSTTALRIFALEVLKAPDGGGPQTGPVNPAAVTETATALVETKTKTVAQSIETASAGALAETKTRPAGQAATTSTAGALAESKTRVVGMAATTAAASAPVEQKRRTLGQAASVSTGGVVTGIQSGGGQTAAVGRALDTATATTAAERKALGVPRASETASGTPLTPRRSRPVQAILEAATARPVGELKRRTVGQAGETTTATGPAELKRRNVGQASTTHVGLPVTRPGQVGLASTLSTATALFRRKLKTLLQATTTHTATATAERKTRPVAQSTETATVRPVTVGHSGQVVTVGQAGEAASAFLITWKAVTPRPAGAVTTVPDLGSVPRPTGNVTVVPGNGVTPRPSGALTPHP